MKRIHDGAIGDLITARVYWNQGDIWVASAPAGLERHRVPDPQLVPLPLALRRPHRRAARPQPRRGLLGARAAPGPAVGMGGRQVHDRARARPELRPLRRRLRVPQRHPRPEHGPADRRLRQRRLRDDRRHQGPVAQRSVPLHRRDQGRGSAIEHEVNPYVQEHIDLLESITSHKPINELKQVAESTLDGHHGSRFGLHRQGSHLGAGARTPSSTPSPRAAGPGAR